MLENFNGIQFLKELIFYRDKSLIINEWNVRKSIEIYRKMDF